MEPRILGSMPWPIRDLLTMKQELVEFALRPGVNRRELFSRYGISAPCAYKWPKRYQSKGVEGLVEHSRRPHHHPAQIGLEVVGRVLEVRDQYPAWGGRDGPLYLYSRPISRNAYLGTTCRVPFCTTSTLVTLVFHFPSGSR
jgi:hypothetical protein